MNRITLVCAALLLPLIASEACREEASDAPPVPPPAEGELSNEEVLAELERMDQRNAALRKSLAEKRTAQAADAVSRGAEATAATGGESPPQRAQDLAPIAAVWASSGDPALRARGRCLAAYAGCGGDGAALDVCIRDLPRCGALGAAKGACCVDECLDEYSRLRRGGASHRAASDAAFLSATTECADRAVALATRRNREATRTTTPRPIATSEVADTVRRGAGAPMVVAVFDTWCPVCRETMPEVADVLARHPEVGALIVSMDDDPDALRTYLRDTALPAVRVLGTPRKKGGLAAALAPTGITYRSKVPHVVLLDARGQVVGEWAGGAGSRLEAALATLR